MRSWLPYLLGFDLWVGTVAVAHAEDKPTECLGYPNQGTLIAARRLQPRKYLRIKKRSESNVWGHPALLQLIDGGAKEVHYFEPTSVALVGDLSSKHGGRLTGHASHQVGRDVDVAFWVTDLGGKPVSLTRFEPFDSKGRARRNNGRVFDLRRNWIMLRYWMDYLRVPLNSVFITSGLRRLLLDYGRNSAEFLAYVPLAKSILKNDSRHNDHFHVRIGCPFDQAKSCKEYSKR